MAKFIGDKSIKQVVETAELTPGGIKILEVEFEDGSKQQISALLCEKVQTDEPIDATALREKRVGPVVEVLLGVLRDWGIKMGELPYLSMLLNHSLDFNSKRAQQELWSKWMPVPKDLDDVDLIAIDRVLKSIKEISPFNAQTSPKP